MTKVVAAPDVPLRVVMFAYDCDPKLGSEHGVGWTWALAASRCAEVTVVTQSKYEHNIVAAAHSMGCDKTRWLFVEPSQALHWVHGLPFGYYVYNWLWQRAALRAAGSRGLLAHADVVHHVTWGACWQPSVLRLAGRPMIWGPAGGAERGGVGFWKGFGPRGVLYEVLRDLARSASLVSPWVRATARGAALVVGRTPESTEFMRALGARAVATRSELCIESPTLGGEDDDSEAEVPGAQFVSVCNLIHWKGVHLAIRAFAEVRTRGCSEFLYTIVGDGPERQRLERLVRQLSLQECVRFAGRVPRETAIALIRRATALVHPSIHDSGGTVCVEAMASGTPVVCLDRGGPGFVVPSSAGVKVTASNDRAAVEGLTRAIESLLDSASREAMGAAGRLQYLRVHTIQAVEADLRDWYERVTPRRNGLDTGLEQ